MNIEMVREDIVRALAEVQRKHSVVFNVGAITYSDTEFRCSLKAKKADETGSTYEADKAEWNRYCTSFGLPKNLIGMSFLHSGIKHVITGIRPKARKYPVACIRMSDNKPFCFPAQSVLLGLMTSYDKAAPRNVTPLVAAITDMSTDSRENALK
jgi:hypothetical protein